MIFHVEPIPLLLSVSINGQRTILKGVRDQKWQKFFWELVGAIIVGSPRDQSREAVGRT